MHAVLATQVVGGAALAAQVVVAQQVLKQLLLVEEGAASTTTVTLWIVALAATFAVINLAASYQGERSRLMSERVALMATDQLLSVAGDVDLEAFEQSAFYDRLQRAQLNAATRPTQIVRAITGIAGSVISVGAVAAGLIVVAPLLAPFVVIAALPAWIAATRDSRELHRFSWDLAPSDRERTYAANVLTQQSFAKEVRAFDLSGFFRNLHRERFAERIDGLREVTRRRIRRATVAGVSRAIVVGAAVAMVVWLVDSERLELSEAGAAVLALLLATQRLAAMVSALGSLHESALFVDDYFDFLSLAASSPTAADVPDSPPAFRSVELQAVSYRYPDTDRDAVEAVSLEVRSGEVVALVGRNGSGKTTVAKLLAGLHEPTTGHLSWDGDGALPHEAVRERTTAIFQDFAKWNLSARLNVALGRIGEGANGQAVTDAARGAEAHDLLNELPSGYDTRLGRLFPDGVDLSIGQWQRIALARALFRDAPLVIMDEPTAALDPAVEFELFTTMRERLRGRALVLVSHRFANVRFADRIYVLDKGKVVEHGSHEDLLATNGLYAQLYRLQRDSLIGDPHDDER